MAADVPETVRESITAAVEQLRAIPARPSEVREFFERLKTWLQEGRALMEEARRMGAQSPRGDAAETETMATARYLVTFDGKGGEPISKGIAALLEIANGEELPRAAAARDRAWEGRLEKWKKALSRARASMSPRQAPLARRRGGQKLGGDKRPTKPAAVPRQ
jgi:type IV secretory pathway TrbL component